MSPKAAALAAWLIVIAFIGIIGGSHIVPQLIFLHNLATSNRLIQGEIVESYPQMHSTCKYRYLVGERFYEQTGRSCGNESVGQQVTVYFSPADPSKSFNENPSSAFANDLIPFIAALALFPIFAAIVAYYRARRASSSRP
jgi:hypothetical protein